MQPSNAAPPILGRAQSPRETGGASDDQMSATRPHLDRCPLCGAEGLRYQFTHGATPIVCCSGCGLLMRNPQPADAELGAIYTEHYFLGSDGPQAMADETSRLKRLTAAVYLDEIEAKLGVDAQGRRGLRLLELGSGLGNLLVEAASRGYEVTGVEYAESSVRAANERLGAARVLQGSIGDVSLPAEHFDVAVLADVIEHTRDPLADLRHVWRVLRPGAVLFIAVPSLDSWSARLMRERWMEFKDEHLFYFDSLTMQWLFFKAGFEQVEIEAGRKRLSPDYVIKHFERFPVPLVSPAARFTRTVLPGPLRRRSIAVVASGINVLGRRAALPPPGERPERLSIVMPVFNERATFPLVIEQLLAKDDPRHGDRDRHRRKQLDGRHAGRGAQAGGPSARARHLRRAAARQGPRRARGPGARDRRLRPDPGRGPRIRPQRLRKPARAAARGTRRVRARRPARDGRPELEGEAFHRSGDGEPGHELRPSVLHRPLQSSSTAPACATRSRCSRCSDATASTV